jgi:hypothetical protein
MRKLILIASLALITPQTRNGTVEITVRDVRTRQPIPAVQVTLTLDPSYEPYIVSPGFTDARGKASFNNLPYGVYELQVQHEGYSRPTSSGMALFLRAEDPELKPEVYLERVATISGRVLDPDGKPVADATVAAWSVGYRFGLRALVSASVRRPSSKEPLVAKTNDRGEYRTPLHPDGEYYVRVSIPDELDTGRRLPRTVFYPGTLNSGNAISVRLKGEDVSGIDIQIPATPVFSVSGTLTNIALPKLDPNRESQARINKPFYAITSDDPDNIKDSELFAVANNDPGIESGFPFTIRGLAPGNYYLDHFFASEQGPVAARTLVRVEDRNIEGLQIALAPTPEIRGRVVAADVQNVPWNRVSVGARAKELLPLGRSFSLPRRVDPQTGQFTLLDLTPGVAYNIVVSGLPPDAYIADMRQGGVSVYNEGTIRSGTAYGEVEIKVSLQGGVVQGVVRDVLGQTVPKAGVVLVPSSPRRGNTQLYKRMAADNEGQFRLTGVAPGEYKLFAWPTLPEGEPEEDEPFLSRYEARGVAVRVAAATSTSATVTVVALD